MSLHKVILYLSFLGGVLFVNAQISAIQSESGETSLTLTNSNQIVFNFSSSEVAIGVNKQFDENKFGKSFFYGIRTSAKVSDNVGNLITDEKFNPSGSFGLTFGRNRELEREIGKRKTITKPEYEERVKNGTIGDVHTIFRWWYGGINIENEGFKLYDTSVNVNDAVVNESDLNINGVAGYNRIGALGENMIVWGLGIKGGSSNNTSDIPNREIVKQTIVTDTQGTILVETSRDKTTGQVNEYDLARGFLNVNFDYLFYIDAIDSKLAIGPSLRSNFTSNIKPQHNVIFGVYWSDAGDGNSLNILGGLQYQWTDVGNIRDSTKKVPRKSLLNFVVGYFFLK